MSTPPSPPPVAFVAFSRTSNSPCCCFQINSHNQVRGHRTRSSHSGVEKYPRGKDPKQTKRGTSIYHSGSNSCIRLKVQKIHLALARARSLTRCPRRLLTSSSSGAASAIDSVTELRDGRNVHSLLSLALCESMKALSLGRRQRAREGGGGGYSFVASLSNWTIDDAFRSRRGIVLAPNRDTSNFGVLSTFFHALHSTF